MSKELIEKNGVGYCPECNSKKISLCVQVVIHKENDYNTGKNINPRNGTVNCTQNKDLRSESHGNDLDIII